MAFAIPAHIEIEKSRRGGGIRHAVVASLIVHGLIFVLSPPFSFKPYELDEPRDMQVVAVLPPDEVVLPEPKEIAPPELQITHSEDSDAPEEPFPGTSPIDFRSFVEPPAPRGTTGEGFIFFDQMPTLLHFERPRYPRLARQAGFEGRVCVEVLVGEDGKVIQAKVVSSEVSAAMEQAALEAAMECRFRPAKQRTTPVRARLVVPFEFRLN